MDADRCADERQRIRRSFLSIRDKIPAQERTAASREITRHLVGLDAFVRKRVVLLYCSYRSEVATHFLLDRCLRENKITCAPVTRPGQGQLLAVRVTDPETELAPGYMGIPEPRKDLVFSRTVDPVLLEAVVVPGAVFDPKGCRLGYGGGFYDRFLGLVAPHALRIGLAFSAQMAASLPALPHDIPMDLVVTETGPLVCSDRGLFQPRFSMTDRQVVQKLAGAGIPGIAGGKGPAR